MAPRLAHHHFHYIQFFFSVSSVHSVVNQRECKRRTKNPSLAGGDTPTRLGYCSGRERRQYNPRPLELNYRVISTTEFNSPYSLVSMTGLC